VRVNERYLPTGDEAGTAPADRKFRPDVQGLRGIAILLVVLFHAGISTFSGGYVGVDVFFVISGFVITGVLLREHSSSGSTSLIAFYGRRTRRILPAATIVIILTVICARLLLDQLSAHNTAVDGQWTSVFLVNFHFAASGSNYLASLVPPSPLQNFWSLAVEEQFYIVYPTIFLLVASLSTRTVSFRARMGIILGVTIVGSYLLSIVMTSSNSAAAFFSPFTRAWELALGALIALGTDRLRQLPSQMAGAITWGGLGAVAVAALTFTSSTPYPGWLVAVPVVGAGLIIAGGAAQPSWGVESVLQLAPLQWLGMISYSLYLWHWPVLMIAAQSRGETTLPVGEALAWVLVSVVLAFVTYYLVENPIRRSSYLVPRRVVSVLLGVCLVLGSLAFTTVQARSINVGLEKTLTAAQSGYSCQTRSDVAIAALRNAYKAAGGVNGLQHPQLRVAVVGDSTACSMLPGLDAVGPSYGLTFENGAITGCGVVSGQVAPYYYLGVNLVAYTRSCNAAADRAESAAIRAAGHPQIILWSSTEERASLVASGSGSILEAGTQRWRDTVIERITAKLHELLGTGAKVILLIQPPFVNDGAPKRTTSSDQSFERLNSVLRDVAAEHPKQVGVINLSYRVCPSGPPCPLRVHGMEIRPDRAHYGSAGTLWVAEWLVPRIVSATHSLGSSGSGVTRQTHP
jgi:peptidoglycan/LPS O-acetylase OafA/YrhL